MTEVLHLPTAANDGKQPGLWPTNTSAGLMDMIKSRSVVCDIALITGPSGAGKTTAARAVQQEADLQSCFECRFFYVSMTGGASGLQPGLQRIGASLGLNIQPHMGAYEAHQILVQFFSTETAVLILDEAQFMSDALLHGIRSLWDDLDRIKQPIGIVLIGTPDLADRIHGRGKAGRRVFDPLRGRIGGFIALEPAGDDDIAAICRHHALAGAQSQGLLRRLANGPGGLHNVRRVLAQAEKLTPAGGRITLAALKEAAEMAGVAS